MLLVIVLAYGASAFAHPVGFERIGDVSDRQGTNPGNAIDGQPGECGTGSSFWAFASSNGAGADFWLQANNSIRTLSVSIQSCSTGGKDFVIKRRDGSYQTVYSLGPGGGNTFGSGSVEGNFIQQDGRIIIGVRNARAEALHYLNDISLDFAYAPLNNPPSAPALLAPAENETIDATASISWNESTDAENDPITYSAGYSRDGTDWNSIEDDSPCCGIRWDSAALEEGSYFVSVKAFDGKSYSEKSVRRINVKHVFFEEALQGKTVLGEPVKWTANAYGSGNRTCIYLLPSGSFNASAYLNDAGVPSQKSEGHIAWNCDFSLGNYTVAYSTPALTLDESGWVQDTGFRPTLLKQKLVETQALKNAFNEAYSNVQGAYACPPNFSCVPDSFEFQVFQPGEINVTTTAEGDGISESESVQKNEYYNKTVTIESALSSLENVSGEIGLPEGLDFTLFVETDGGFTQASEKGIEFSLEAGNAQVVFQNLSKGTTALLFTAKLKENGESCGSDDQCVTGYCSIICTVSNDSKDSNESFDAAPSATPFAYEQGFNATHYARAAENASEGVEIIIPDEVELGWQNASFLREGNPAEGKAFFYSPDGVKFQVFVENGSAKFFFDKTGFWRIAFEGKTKEVKAYTAAKPNVGKTQAITAQAIAFAGPLPLLAVGAFAFLFVAFKKFKRKGVSISGEWKDGRLELKLKNGFGDLHDAVLTQMVEEGSTESHSPDARRTETVTGDLLEWELGKIPAGAELCVSYACPENAGRKPAVLKANAKDSKSVNFRQA